MKLTLGLILFFVSLLWVTLGYCYKPDYAPFPQTESLPLCAMQPLSITKQTVGDDPFSPRIYEVIDQNKTLKIVVYVDENNGYVTDLVWGDGADAFLRSLAIGGTPFTFGGLYWAYLNDDDRKDFIIMTGFDGVGLAASSGQISFILSTSRGYTFQQSMTWEPRPSELVNIAGKCCYILTTFAEGLQSKDGKEHNYWAYNLFSFQDDQLVLANQLDPRFPKWVMYTWDANHVETSYLTSEQKAVFLQKMHGEKCDVMQDQ